MSTGIPTQRQSGEWTYVTLTIAAFVFIPEIRRIADWRGAYDPLNAFAAVPLLMLCPIAIFTILRRNAITKPFALVAVAWVSGFAYALLVGVARGALNSGLYAFAQFVFPLVIGAWLVTRPELTATVHKRLAHWLLFFGAVAGIYGIFQYIIAPPWDTEWMQNIGAGSFGVPVPFGIRVFGVLNSPGTYGLFLGCVVLINLPFLSYRNFWQIIATVFVIIGLMLSFIRAGWLAVLVGLLVFIILSPHRRRPLLGLACLTSICAIAIIAFIFLIPSQGLGDKLSARVGTFTDLTDDESAADRRATSLATFETALEQPIGAGLGLTGGSSKLDTDVSALVQAPTGDIDNGFASRLFEMGAIGFLAWLLACAVAIGTSVHYYRLDMFRGNTNGMQLVAACIAIEVAIFLLNLTGDNQQGILAMIFFMAVAIPMINRPQLRASKTTA